MSPARIPTILVGVSGSPASEAALRWAEAEAERCGGRLRVVLTWHPEQRAFYASQADPADSFGRRERAQSYLAKTVRAVLGPVPEHDTVTEAVEGTAERTLVAESATADLLVLGSGPGISIGPVVRACLNQASCPVVVVSSRTLYGEEPQEPRHRPTHAGCLSGRRGLGHQRLPTLVPAPSWAASPLTGAQE